MIEVGDDAIYQFENDGEIMTIIKVIDTLECTYHENTNGKSQRR